MANASEISHKTQMVREMIQENYQWNEKKMTLSTKYIKHKLTIALGDSKLCSGERKMMIIQMDWRN